MTIGDVLGVIALIVLIAASWAATILMSVLLFPGRVARAGRRIEEMPGKCFLRGLGVFLVVGFVAVALANAPAGPVRLLGGALWAGMFVVALLGAAGITRMIGERIDAAGTQMTPFASLTRGAILYVLACLLPIVGWFLVLPVVTLIALGSGVSVLRGAPKPKAATVTPAPQTGAESPA